MVLRTRSSPSLDEPIEADAEETEEDWRQPFIDYFKHRKLPEDASIRERLRSSGLSSLMRVEEEKKAPPLSLALPSYHKE
jgi:hypothetical protein